MVPALGASRTSSRDSAVGSPGARANPYEWSAAKPFWAIRERIPTDPLLLRRQTDGRGRRWSITAEIDVRFAGLPRLVPRVLAGRTAPEPPDGARTLSGPFMEWEIKR